MANPVIPEQPKGSLIKEEYHPGFNKFSFIPPKEKLKEAGLKAETPMSYIVQMLDVNEQENYVTIYPINTLSTHPRFLKSKYQGLKSITLANFDLGGAEDQDEVTGLLENMPTGFVRDFNYGLGFLKDYSYISNVVEHLGFEHLVIDLNKVTEADEENKMLILKYSEFDEIRKLINRITYASQKTARKVKSTSVYNSVCFYLRDEKNYPQNPLDIKDTYIDRSIAKYAELKNVGLSKSERSKLVKTINNNTKGILEEDSQALVKLKNEIELVTLDVLINVFEGMLSKKLSENKWQELFLENPFVLNLLFGYPIITINDQASVGGRKISGEGEKITDFLMKNIKTNNTALIEIKKPQTLLLNKRPYREGLYSPSTELSGSINQVLDQRHKLQKEISVIKDNSGVYDIETYAVHCVLIIGLTPKGREESKSLEIFRRNSRDVDIITFDEVLEKLNQLHAFLSGA